MGPHSPDAYCGKRARRKQWGHILLTLTGGGNTLQGFSCRWASDTKVEGCAFLRYELLLDKLACEASVKILLVCEALSCQCMWA